MALEFKEQIVPDPDAGMSVLNSINGKNIFLTGATGFVGKVIAEKLLRSTNVEKIFLLIRPRKGSTADARMVSEIINSEIFTRCKREMGEQTFLALAKSKLYAVAGELTMSNCGISNEDLRQIKDKVEVIIHCAAIVDFNERLDRAIELNVLGSLRMMDIAKESVKCNAFVHVSTCYVNSNQQGFLEEKLYPLGFEPEDILKKIQNMPNSELEKIADTGILREWPNTYTFTKAMTEQLLVKNRGNVPLAIVRPSIVGASWREPFPGWVDVISAAGAVYLSAGLGMLKFLPGRSNRIADVVPVDYVTNSILCAVSAMSGKNGKFMVTHSATGSEYPMTWEIPTSVVKNWFIAHPPSTKLSKPVFRFIKSPQEYQIQFFLNYSVPASIMNVLAPLGTKSHKEKAALFSKLVFKVRVLVESFKHFVSHEWLFDNSSCRVMYGNLNDEEKALFPLDLKNSMDWVRYNGHFSFGLLKYILRDELSDQKRPAIKDRMIQLHQDHWAYFSPQKPGILRKLLPDSWWANAQMKAYEAQNFPPVRPVKEMQKIILASPKVQAALKAEVAKQLHGSKNMEMAESRACEIIERMFGEAKMPAIATLGVTLRKVLRRLYDSIIVDSSSLEKIREAATNGGLVFVPTHRSYVDFLIVSYICFSCQLPIPFIAAGEDFLGVVFVRWLFRVSGAFFLRRSFLGEDDLLYSTIFKEYTTQLMADGNSIEFFIEGTRSRSGKMLQPKLGLLSIINGVYLDNGVDDINYVPMTINYEKTLEGEMYSSELEGAKKIRESLRNLLKGSGSLLNTNFGTISVVVHDPISTKDYTAELIDEVRTVGIYPPYDKNAVPGDKLEKIVPVVKDDFDPFTNTQDRRYLNRRLAYKIIHTLAKGQQCMPTHMVSTLLLMYRQGITKQNLMAKVEWLGKEIENRGGRLCEVEGELKNVIIDKSVKLLTNCILQRRVDFLEPAIESRHDYSNMLVFGHYRNKLVHHFYPEGLWAVALYSFGHDKMEHGVDKKALIKEVSFLHSLLWREFIWKENPDTPEDFEASLIMMVNKGILHLTKDGGVEVAETGETHFSFLCALYWPFIDSYFVTVMMLFSLQPDRSMEEKMLLQRTQWLATTLYHESMLCFYESCSFETLSNAFDLLAQWGVISLTPFKKQAKSKFDKKVETVAKEVKLMKEYQDESKLQSLIDHIGRLRKPPVRSGSSSLRRNLVADIPILAKM